MRHLRLLRAAWRALRDTVRPTWEHARLIFDTRLRVHSFDVHGRGR